MEKMMYLNFIYVAANITMTGVFMKKPQHKSRHQMTGQTTGIILQVHMTEQHLNYILMEKKLHQQQVNLALFLAQTQSA